MNKKQAAALAAIILLQFMLVVALSHQRPMPDEGRYLTTGWMISLGKVPYIDTFSPKPPGTEFVFATIFTLFGPSYALARLVMAAVAALQIVLLFVLAKKIFGEKAALLSALFYVLWSAGFAAYWAVIDPFLALISTAAILFFYKFLFESRSRANIFAAGLFLGLNIVFKHTMLLFAVAIIAAIAAIGFFKNKRSVSAEKIPFFPAAAKKIPFFLAGFLAIPLLFLLYLLANNALPAFIDAMLFPLSQVSNFSSIVIDARSLVAVAAFSAVPLVLAALWLNALDAREKTLEIALLLAWFLFSFSNALPFRACCMHLLPALPPASILAGFVIGASLRRGNRRLTEACFALFSAALLIASVLAAAFIFSVLSSPAYSFSNIEGVAALVRENTESNDTILVFTASPEVYFLSQRMPGAKQFVFFDPCPDACQRRVIQDMSERKPEMVVYFMVGSEKAESGMPLVDALVEENYALLEAMQLQPPLYTFYTHALIFKKNV